MRPGVRLALDLGEARIGVAACDRDATLAFGVETVPAADRPAAYRRVVALAGEYEPVEVVIGLPRSLHGGEGPAAARIRVQAAELAGLLAPIPVRLVDERFTTTVAQRQLRAGGRSARQQRGVIDQVAAAGILEYALDGERSTGSPPGELLSTPT